MTNQTSVKIIADSYNAFSKKRLTTFELRYPRCIHSELMTHRMFSRNAGSSRAKPTKTLLKQDIFIPKEFKRNQSGMQPSDMPVDYEQASQIWKESYESMETCVRKLSEDLNVHKQWTNRLIEPYTYIDVVVSATEFTNFFNLRCHPAAQSEMQELANLMKHAYEDSDELVVLFDEDWHLPYVSYKELDTYDIDTCKKMSIARCARISYKPFDEDSANVEKDILLHDKLKQENHWSPFEHAATVGKPDHWYANFNSFQSYRSILQKIPPHVYVTE